MDVLLLNERIRIAVEMGEGHFREFKSGWEGPPNSRNPREPKAIAKDIGEALVAFSNADGGELLVGVEDDGTVTGINYREDTVAQLLQAPVSYVYSKTPLNSPIARHVSVDGKSVLYFSVDKSTKYVHLTSDGRCLQRDNAASLPVSVEHLQFERQEQVSREYDRQFVDEASERDLDMDLVKKLAYETAKGTAPEKWLQYLDLAEYALGALRFRRAALLLFAKDIIRWHPRCQVRIVRFRGTEVKEGRQYNAESDDLATGNVIHLLLAAWEKLRPHLVETKLAPDAVFKEQVMYPEDACREALINAIAHRDYSIEGRNTEILIFDDRMEVHSPGALLSTVRLDELKKLQGLHQSRNAFIARVLREIGYMLEMGEGMRRIFRLMRESDLVAPELRSEPNRFSIILRHKSVFSDADQRWLDGYGRLRLNREEMLVALHGKDGRLMSAQGIFDSLRLVDWDVYRAIVDQMLTKGILYKPARTKAKTGRDVRRYAIRQPDECEQALSTLFSTISRTSPVDVITRSFLASVLEHLPIDNPYRSNETQLGVSRFAHFQGGWGE